MKCSDYERAFYIAAKIETVLQKLNYFGIFPRLILWNRRAGHSMKHFYIRFLRILSIQRCTKAHHRVCSFFWFPYQVWHIFFPKGKGAVKNKFLILKRDSSRQIVHGFKVNGIGVASYIGCLLIGSLNLNEYWSMTGYLIKAEKGTGHPSALCRWVV